MALLKRLDMLPPARNRVHDPVSATVTAFMSKGQPYLQIDSYGSSDREMQGTVSQSIQFDREGAEQLLSILKDAFSLR